MATRVISLTTDDEHQAKAKIIVAILSKEGIDNISALFRHLIDKYWEENQKDFQNFIAKDFKG